MFFFSICPSVPRMYDDCRVRVSGVRCVKKKKKKRLLKRLAPFPFDYTQYKFFFFYPQSTSPHLILPNHTKIPPHTQPPKTFTNNNFKHLSRYHTYVSF